MNKKFISLVLVFCILALSVPMAYAGSSRTSHVEFYGSAASLYARALVTGNWNLSDSFLVIAVYSENGNISDFAISEVGNNKVITAGPVNSQNGSLTKAFVWQKSTNLPLSKVSTYNASENKVLKNMQILFDGLTLSEYTAGELEFSADTADYTIDMAAALKTKLPVVTAACGDNSAEVSVHTDSQSYKTTVTVSYGVRTSQTSDISEYLANYDGSDKNLYTYSKESKVYTFNYSNIEKITGYIAFNGTCNYGFYNNYNQKYLYSKAYELSEGETYKKVKISFADTSDIYNKIALFVIPKDSQYKGSVVAVPVTDEETGEVTGVKAPDLADDLAITQGINPDGTYVYGKRSADKIVSVSSTNASATHTGRLGYVRYNYRKYDPENYVTGALARSPSDITADVMDYTANHGFVRSIYGNEADAAFLGCEYIPVWATSGANKKQLTLEFYISKDATIAIYSSVKTLGISFDDSETNASYTTQTVYPVYCYGNQISATDSVLTADPARFNLIKAIFKHYGNFDLDKDVVVTSSGVIPSRFNTYFSFDVEGQTCDVEKIRKACLTDAEGNFAANDARLYEADGTTSKTVDEIIEMFKADPANEFVKITYVNPAITDEARKPQAIYYDGETSVFGDLSEGSNGKIKSYGDILEFNGTQLICGSSDWYSTYFDYGANTNASDYTSGSYTRDTWYSFTVNQPSQIFVYANENAANLLEDATYWNEVLVGDDAPAVLMNNTAEAFDSIYMYSAKAGESISIKTPGSDAKFFVAVKPVKNNTTENLNGKKFLFIGNSFTYYGKCVLNKSALTLDARINDKGYFYQLCKENGAEVSVTNWTFGGHTLEDTFMGSCAANRGHDGYDHLAQLTDRYYDYVMVQPGSREDETNFIKTMDYITDIFRKENPNVKFFCLVPRSAHTTPLAGILNNLKVIEEKGIIVVDWPELVCDIIDGKTEVSGSDITYNKNTFIVSKDASDGYHPNMLTGYITALMTYSAITGEFAKGQPYEFCTDTSVNSAFNVTTYLNTYYTYGDTSTTFPDVFESEHDMAEIQKLVDKYFKEKNFRNYNFE